MSIWISIKRTVLIILFDLQALKYIFRNKIRHKNAKTTEIEIFSLYSKAIFWQGQTISKPKNLSPLGPKKTKEQKSGRFLNKLGKQ